MASNNENGIYLEEFHKRKPPFTYGNQKNDEIYLLKRYDAGKDSILSLGTYGLDELL